MGSSLIYISPGVIYIDLATSGSLSTFNVTQSIYSKNKGAQRVYLKATLIDSNGKWTFDDGTTSKELGYIDGFSEKDITVVLQRANEGEVEESISIKVELFKDSGYTQLVDSYTIPIEVIIADFVNSSNWTILTHDTFDDGTSQGWTTSNGGVSDTASIEANGYSLYNSLRTGDVTFSKSSVSIPSASKVVLIFHTAHYASSGSYTYPTHYINNLRVKVENDEYTLYKGYLLYKHGTSVVRKGWYQFGLDLTKYSGKTVDLSIVLYHYLSASFTNITYLDEVKIAYKP